MPNHTAPARRAKSRTKKEPPAEPPVDAVRANPPRGAYRAKDASWYLQISIPTLHREIKSGKLRPCRQVRHLRFLKSELDRWLEAGMA